MDASNPFADPTMPTLEEVRDAIAAHYDLPHQLRIDLVSALNACGRWFDLPLSMVPANMAFLRKKFEHFHPIHAGVKVSRVRNVRSLIMRAFRELGLSVALSSYLCPLSDKWMDSLSRCSRYQRCALSRFAHYCSGRQLSPDHVNDMVLADYLVALERETLIKNPRTVHKNTCRVWNRCAAEIDGWPQITVAVPRYDQRNYAIDDNQLHRNLRAEFEAYIAVLQGNDLSRGPKRPLRPRSIDAVRQAVRRYVSALHHSGLEIGRISSLADLVEFEQFRRAIQWMVDRNGGETSQSIGDLAWQIRNIAIKWVGVDDRTAEHYANAVARLKLKTAGLSAKNRAALHQFDDREAAGRFLSCPDVLWAQAQKASGKKAQPLAQSAIAIAILIFAPIRLANLQTIRVDRHLAKIGGRRFLQFDEHEVKNRRALRFKLPAFLDQWIDKYLELCHSRFLDGPNHHLFPGRGGKPKDLSRLRQMITGAVFKETGIRLSPHQFRHVAAKLLLDRLPGHYEVVRKLLGHKKLSTVYEHYTGAETDAAIELYDDLILELKVSPAIDNSSIDQPHRKTTPRRTSRRKPHGPAFDPLNLYGGGVRR